MGDGFSRSVNIIRNEGFILGRLKGKAEGILEGKAETIKSIVEEMIKENFNNEIISKVCKVNSSYIDNLRKKD